MSGEHGNGRLQVETWEIELAKRIAGSFRPGDEELAAELFKRIVEIKSKRRAAIRCWQGFLAQSLYNAAKNFIRHEDVLRRRARFAGAGDECGRDGSSDLETVIGPEDPIELRLHLDKVWQTLTPEMRELAKLLLEEGGNTSSVAKRWGRPRKTVEYWIQKLRSVFEKGGLE